MTRDEMFQKSEEIIGRNLRGLISRHCDPEVIKRQVKSVLDDLIAEKPWEDDRVRKVLKVEVAEDDPDKAIVTVSVPYWLAVELGLLEEERREVCTGITAVWCPIHGDCICRRSDQYEVEEERYDCPLHGRESMHGEMEVQGT